MKTRILLFAHGARDPRWSAPLERLAEVVRAGDESVEVGLAFLEFMTPSLPDAIAQAVEQGIAHVRVVPVFRSANIRQTSAFFSPARGYLYSIGSG